MPNDLIKFPAGSLEMGVDTFTPDFTGQLVLAPTSRNMMTGINKGVGPRYGISPIPGHSTLDTTVAADGRGLRSSEQTTGTTLDFFTKRKKLLGILPIQIGSYDDLTVKGRIFIWLLADNYTGTSYALSATPNVVFTDGGAQANTFKYSFDISYGFNNNFWDQATVNGTVFTISYPPPTSRRVNNTFVASSSLGLKSILDIGASKYFGSSVAITVPNKSFPQKWLLGQAVTLSDGTRSAIPNFCFATPNAGSTVWTAGISPSFNLRNYKKNQRTLKLQQLTSAGALQVIHTYAGFSVDDTTYLQNFNNDFTIPGMGITGASTASTLNDRGTAYVPAATVFVLLNDDALVCDSSYTMVLHAAGKAFAYMIQDWERDYSGRNIQAVQLTNLPFVPITTRTIGSTTAFYTENTVEVANSFHIWPSFVSGTPLIKDSASPNASGADHISLGDAGSGVLRSNTVYEFTFSIFDKQTGYESNVGKPAKIQTGADDFVAITLLRDQVIAGVYQQNAAILVAFNVDYQNFLNRVTGTPPSYKLPFNMSEIRFYYRPFGSYEWLPAMFVDAVQYYWDTTYRKMWGCTGQIAALPGGQPGGFVDHSLLPDDQYDCVVQYKNRAFWLSQKNLVFSTQNNLFEYPLRNSASAPTGGYRGAIVHTYRGQSVQESRLIIFGQKEVYIGRFTGIFQQMPVAVSPDVVASYDVDGSDFRIEPWTSITAFSHRSAVVADGILYWWGPQGIYRDDGVDVPTKISRNLEPNIYTLYDQTLIDEIHCIYDEKTRDIQWFYPPKDNNTKTSVITYDVQTESFLFDDLDCKVDWATRISTNNAGVSQDTNGLRTIIAARKSSSDDTQRGYFFDQLNRSGDMRPETELICKAVAAGSASNLKVLTFDSGLNAANFATIAVGDKIGIQQFMDYTTQSTGDDIIAKVNAINLVTPSLTIEIPSSATLPVCSPTERMYFPIWHAAKAGAGLNGISYNWESKYWMPNGVNFFGIWQWIYIFFKYTTWKKVDTNAISLAYRSASGGAALTDAINLIDNSDANFQLYHALREGKLNNQGQALKIKISGYHIGEEWAMQYLEAQSTEETGNLLKMYQG